MDFEQIRIFQMLVEEKTFLGAANRLGTSRSRVRRKLAQLESETGTELLARARSGFELTPAGEIFARRGRAILHEADVLLTNVREVGTVPSGLLRVALPLGPLAPTASEAFGVLQHRYPELRFETHFASDPLELLRDRAEVAICFEGEAEPDWYVTVLSEVPMRLFAGRGYLGRKGHPESPDELSQHHLAVWDAGRVRPNRLPLSGGRSLPIEPKFWSDDPAAVYRLARDEDYLAYVPDLVGLRDNRVTTLLVEEIRGVVRERLVVPEMYAELPRVRAFVDLCQAAKPGELTPV